MLKGTSGQLINGFFGTSRPSKITKDIVDRERGRLEKYLSDNGIDATGFSDEQMTQLYLLFLEKFGFGG